MYLLIRLTSRMPPVSFFFTFQNGSITHSPLTPSVLEETLHSKMDLLIRNHIVKAQELKTLFTFQNGSINTQVQQFPKLLFQPLHSKMDLLIQEQAASHGWARYFTFQNGSINTPGKEYKVSGKLTLHSKMDLLILLQLRVT